MATTLTKVPIMGTIVPIMGTSKNNKSTASVLFGKTRLSILSLLFMNEEQSFYLREIIERLGMGSGTVQREINNLCEAGIINRKPIGNQVHYSANRESSIFPELKSLLVKTSAVADVVRQALLKLGSRVHIAFIFGSFASGDFSAESDIDLMVVGEVSLKDIVSALLDTQETLGREINPTVYSRRSFNKKLREDDHFLSEVISKPKIMIIGKADDIEKPG